jgi:hypothetical protein
MILLYSLDDRQVSHHILFFYFYVFIFKCYHLWWCGVYSRSQFELATLIRVQNLSQRATDFWKKWHIWDLHRLILNDKFKYEKIKLKKRMWWGTWLTSKMYDKIIKGPSKSYETIPLSAWIINWYNNKTMMLTYMFLKKYFFLLCAGWMSNVDNTTAAVALAG